MRTFLLKFGRAYAFRVYLSDFDSSHRFTVTGIEAFSGMPAFIAPRSNTPRLTKPQIRPPEGSQEHRRLLHRNFLPRVGNIDVSSPGGGVTILQQT